MRPRRWLFLGAGLLTEGIAGCVLVRVKRPLSKHFAIRFRNQSGVSMLGTGRNLVTDFGGQRQSMKREGRIHGCNVRVGKRAWGGEGGGYRGKVTFYKPTNQSKSAMKHPVPSSVAQVVVYNEPVQKSIGKTKSAFKAKDLDITRNHLMQDWSIYEHGLPVEENYDDEDGSDNAYPYREHWASDEYRNGGDNDDEEAEEAEEAEDEEEQQEEEEEEEYWDAENRARSQMVLPIESLLTVRKRKIAPAKANGVQQKQQLTLTDAVGVAEIVVEGAAAADDGNNSDQFESWWGLGFYDEEEVPDDWFLITEGEDFVVPA